MSHYLFTNDENSHFLQKSAKYRAFNPDLREYLLSTGSFLGTVMAAAQISPRGFLGMFNML